MSCALGGTWGTFVFNHFLDTAQCGLPWGGIVARVVPVGKRTAVERYRQVGRAPFADTQDYTVNDLNQVTGFDNTQRALFIGKGALAEESTLKLDSEGGTPTHVNRAHDYFYDSREKAMTSDGWVSGVLLRDDVPEALADIPLRAAEEGREFDADGNPETSGSATFVYDAENRLIPSGGAPAGAHDFFWWHRIRWFRPSYAAGPPAPLARLRRAGAASEGRRASGARSPPAIYLAVPPARTPP